LNRRRLARPPRPRAPGRPLTPGERFIIEGLQSARLNRPVEPIGPTTKPTKRAAMTNGFGAVVNIAAAVRVTRRRFTAGAHSCHVDPRAE
jgi:hypothetical protein